MYLRSHEMSSFIRPKVENFASSRMNPTVLRAERYYDHIKGTSMVIVAGTGGYSLRSFGRGKTNPWWAAKEAFNTGLQAGAHFCKFNLDGDPELAFCYYKDPTKPGILLDQYFIRTKLPSPKEGNELVKEFDSTFHRFRVTDGNNDVHFQNGLKLCNWPYLVMESSNDGGDDMLMLIRIESLEFGKVDAAHLLGAYLDLQIHQHPLSNRRANFSISIEMSPNSAPFCGDLNNPFEDLGARPWSEEVVDWMNIQPWDGFDENFAAGTQVQTPDLSKLINLIVSMPGWRSGNAVTFKFSGHGRRAVASVETGTGCSAPSLVLEVETPCFEDEAPKPCRLANGIGEAICKDGYIQKCIAKSCQKGFEVSGEKCVGVSYSGQLLLPAGRRCTITEKHNDDMLHTDEEFLVLKPEANSICNENFVFTNGGKLQLAGTNKCAAVDVEDVHSTANMLYLLDCDTPRYNEDYAGNYGVLIPNSEVLKFEVILNEEDERAVALRHIESHLCVTVMQSNANVYHLVLNVDCYSKNSQWWFMSATERPSKFPTRRPTTKTPTKRPTKLPTRNPTRYPTR